MTRHFEITIAPTQKTAVIEGRLHCAFPRENGAPQVGDTVAIVVRPKTKGHRPRLFAYARCTLVEKIQVTGEAMFVGARRLTRDHAEKVIADVILNPGKRLRAGESVPDYFTRTFGAPSTLGGTVTRNFERDLVHWDDVLVVEKEPQ